MLKHTIEELGEYADTHGNGRFHLFKQGPDDPYKDPAGRWGCAIGHMDAQYGANPKEAVQKVLNWHDRQKNPDAIDGVKF